MVKGVRHLGLGRVEAMEAGGREFSLHGRVVKGVRHLGLGRVEAMEAGGRGFEPRPGGTIVGRVSSPTWQLVRLSQPNVPFFQNSEYIWNNVLVGKPAICAFPL